MTGKPAPQDGSHAPVQDDILHMLEKRARQFHHQLAGNKDAGNEVLAYLAQHGEVATRRAVAANPATPAEANVVLAEDEDSEVRAELARKIARIMPGLSTKESAHILALTIEALETLRLEAGAFPRGEAHLARMQRTARHFGLRFSMPDARVLLNRLAAEHPGGPWRVRLTLDAAGQFGSQVLPLAPTPEPVRLVVAASPIATRGAAGEFLRHKTTRREAYAAFAAAKPPEAFDVILWNEAGELTECSFGNLALEIDGRWLTPRLEAGLLPGVLRAELLAQGRLTEARLTREDPARATGIAFLNSLRGWLPAVLG